MEHFQKRLECDALWLKPIWLLKWVEIVANTRMSQICILFSINLFFLLSFFRFNVHFVQVLYHNRSRFVEEDYMVEKSQRSAQPEQLFLLLPFDCLTHWWKLQNVRQQKTTRSETINKSFFFAVDGQDVQL